MEIVELIKQEMKKRDMSPHELARLVNRSGSTLTRTLKREMKPSWGLMVDVCKALKMPLQIEKGNKTLIIK